MDILSVLSSINKISLIAFFCVFAALVYELMLLKKGQKRKGKPTIPKFNTNTQAQATVGKVVVPQAEKKKEINFSRLGIVFVIIITVGLGVGIFVINKALQENNDTSSATIQPLNTKASDVSITPSNETLVQVTSTPTPLPTSSVPDISPTVTETEPNPTQELLALNNISPSVSPSLSPSPTSTTIPSPTEEDSEEETVTVTQSTTVTTTPSSLPISGNTTFTVMAIAISGIIVLVSFVF